MTVPTMRVSSLPAGTTLSKFLIVSATALDRQMDCAEMAEQLCRDVPTVAAVFRAQKSAVAAGTTTTGGGPLATFGIAQEAFALLQSASILGRLSPSFRRVPFHGKVAKELGDGIGAVWRGEGLPIPVSRAVYDVLDQEYFGVDALIVLSKDVFRFGAAAESALRAAVIAGIARYLDAQLLDPSVAATATHPASLTHNATTVTSSGSSSQNILTDLERLLTAIETPGDGLRWVMRPITLFRIAARLASLGVNVTSNNLLGIPCVLGSTSPHQVALIDASGVAYSSDDRVDLDVSTRADVEMSDAPTQNATTGTGAAMVSLFQQNLVGIRAGVAANWQHTAFADESPARPAGAAVMTGLTF